MRISILLGTALLAFSLSAHAQSTPATKRPLPSGATLSKKYNYGRPELSFEIGGAFAFTPNVVVKPRVLSPSTRNTGLGIGGVVKYIFPSYSKFRLGLRAAASSLRVYKDARILYNNGTIEDIHVKYANPLLQLGLQVHYDAHLSSHLDLRVSPFAGYGFAWSEKLDGSPSSVSNIPVGNSHGFNVGGDLTLKYKATSNIFVTLSSGYQHSWMRLRQSLVPGTGFNISHIPVGVGVGLLF